jgi:hypothetical protein
MRALSISRHFSVGPESAPDQSCYCAMSLTPQQIAKPFVGVVSCAGTARLDAADI